MTQEEFERRLKEMSNDDIIEKAEQEVSRLAQSYGKSFTMHIPPHINDTDMILSEIIRRYKDLLQKSGDLNEKKYQNITPEQYEEFSSKEKEAYFNTMMKRVKWGFNSLGHIVPKNIQYYAGAECDVWYNTESLFYCEQVFHRIKPEAEEV